MSVFKATEHKSSKSSFKATNNKSFNARVLHGWQKTNKDSSDAITQYYERIKNNEYIGTSEMTSFRSAIDSYVDSTNKLRGFNKRWGGAYTDEEEKEWGDAVSSINTYYDNASKYYSNWKTEKEYKDALKAQKEYEEKKSFDLGAGQTEIDEWESLCNEAKELEWKVVPEDSPTLKAEGYGQATQEEKDRYFEIADYFAQNGISIASDGYIDYDAIESGISKKKAYYKDAEKIQKNVQKETELREAAFNAEDFEEYAKKGADIENPTFWDAQGWLTIAGNPVFGDDVNNKVTFMQDEHNYQSVGMSGTKIANTNLHFMDENEVKTYNYYLGKGDTATAEEYLNVLDEWLTQREAKQIAKNAIENDLEWVMAISAGLDQFASGVKGTWKAITGDDSYTPTSATQIASAIVRENIDSDVGRFFYDFGVTASNQLPSILVGSVTRGVGGLATMGVSVYGNAYTEMINLGYDKNQANAYAALTTVAELGLQKLLGGYKALGGGKLSNGITEFFASKVDNALAKFAIRNVGSMIGEGIEEALQSVLEPTFKSLVTGDRYSVDLDEVIYSGLLGAFSAGALEGVPSMVVGGVSAGVNAISDAVNTSKMGKEFKKSGDLNALKSFVLDESNKFSADSVAYKLAGKVNEKTSAYKIGKLLREANAFISEQNKADIKKSLTDKGVLPKDADRYVNAISALVAGYEFTAEQISALNVHPAVKQTLVELLDDNSTVSQRLQGYAEAVKMVKAKPETAQNGAIQNASTNAPTEAVTDENKAKESVYNYSADGKTIYNNEEVSIKEISSIKDGEVFVRLEDGREVNAKAVSFSTQDEALMYEMVADLGVTPETATAMMSSFNKGKATTSAQDFRADGTLAYKYGLIGYAKGLVNLNLTEDQKWDLFKLGRKQAEKNAEALDAASKNGIAKGKPLKFEGEKTKKNGVTYVGIDPESNFKDVQKAGIIGAEILAKSSNLDIVLYESYRDENGNIVVNIDGEVVPAPNGMFREGNKIYLDINAGNNQEGTILYALSHEVGHFIRMWNPKAFKELGDFLFEHYDGKIPVETLINDEIKLIKKRYKAEGKSLPSETELYDMAYEEVVCNAFSELLADENAYIKLAELKKQNQSLWAKIGAAIKKFLDKLKKVIHIYSKYNPSLKNEVMTKDMTEETFNKLQDMYIKAFVEADANYAKQSNADKTLSNNGIIVNADTESASLYSVRDLLDGKQREQVAKALSERFGVTAEEAKNWISAETSLASIILNPKYSQYLDYTADPDEEAIKKNSDYPQGTVDFSNICKKRRDFTDVMNRVLRRFPNHVFEATDLAKIRTIMSEENMEVACGICYVEDRRQLDSIVAQDFINSLALYREGSKTRPDGKPFNTNQLKALKMIDGNAYTPSIYELVSLEGRNALKAKNPAMEQAWVKFNNARGMQSVRLLLNDAEYKRQILKYSPDVVKRKNDYGGLRIYSFSDMEMFHLIDIIQVITDSATVGLSIQGYTKVNEYARAVKDTGEKLNRSLIPKGDLGYHMENGRVVLDYDTVEGIDINHPDFFDSTDNPNVGNIVIGINDTQIKAAMVDKFIDYIIPFHTGQSKEVLGEKGIAEWNNYEDSQSERDIATGKKSSHQINIYTEVIQAAEKEGKPITNKVEFVNKFLAVCKENGLKPRFSEFLNTSKNGEYLYTEGYHKFLVDFKMFDSKTGEYLPQIPVKPIFDSEYLTSLLKDYVKSQQEKDAKLAESMPTVLERITNEIVKPDTKYSTRETSWRDVEKIQGLEDYSVEEVSDIVRQHIETIAMDMGEEISIIDIRPYGSRARGTAKNSSDLDVVVQYEGDIREDDMFNMLNDEDKLVIDGIEVDINPIKADDTGTIEEYLDRVYGYDKYNDAKYSTRDSAGNELTEEQAKFFKDSKVRDGKGRLQVVYHGTTSEFNTFKRGDIGYHFGSYAQARNRLSYQSGKKRYIKAYLDIKNPLVIEHDSGSWHGNYAAGMLLTWGDFNSNSEAVEKLQEIANMYDTRKSDAELKNLLKSLGYDGIQYLNTHESDFGKESYSYIAFDSNQIKLVENKTPTSDPDIRYSVRESEQAAKDFAAYMKDITNKRGWRSSDVYDYVEAHPELNFIERIYEKDKQVKNDLASFLEGINDTKTLDSLSWFLGGAYSDKGYSWKYDYDKRGIKSVYPYSGAIRTFRNAIKKRINAIMTEKVGGTNLGVKNGEYSLYEIKELFNKLNSNTELGELAEKVFDTVKTLGVNIRFANAMFDPKALGVSLGDMIEYKTSYFNDTSVTDQSKASTILHELIHACTVYVMDTAKTVGERIDNLSSEKNKKLLNAAVGLNKIYHEILKDSDFNGQYALKNAKEMVAELSNPNFVDLLKKKNLWERIVDWICNLFGIKRGTSAYDNAKLCLDYILDNPDYASYKKIASYKRDQARRDGLDTFGETKYSDREVSPITDEDYSKVESHFGTTRNYEVAGYMLKNGKMLDFSGKHWGDDYSTSRQVDHRDIQEVLEGRGNNGVNAMIDMISNGNIRLKPEMGGINLAIMPTAEQINQLRGYINHFRGEIIVDVDAVGGDTIHSWEYNRGTSSARILSDIKEYFEKGTIPQPQSSLNQFLNFTRYSLRDVDPIEPTSNKWGRTLTTAEVKAKFPDLWDVSADESEVRNPTQISGTVRSYRKVYDFLKKTGFKGTILDASSGLGYGTKAGIEEYGFNVDDIEPYPDKSYKPKYTDYSKLNKKYDVIISNAVLNVIPQDQRDALVVKMGELLKDGGRMFINVRGDDVKNASSKVAINEDLMEYYISNTGSYQKGFKKTELVAYLQDALGEGYSVMPTTFFGKTSAVVTKKEGQTKYSVRDYAPTFYSQMGKVVEGMKQDKFAANSIVPMLRGRGVKAEEIRWSGIATWLEGKKSVTKQELLEFIAGSQLQIGEATRDDRDVSPSVEQAEAISQYETARDKKHATLKKAWNEYYEEEFTYGANQLYLTSETESLIRKMKRKPFDEKIEALREELNGILDINNNLGFQSKYRAWEWLGSTKNMFTGKNLGENISEEFEAVDSLVRYFGEQRGLDDAEIGVFADWIKTDILATRESTDLTKEEEHLVDLARAVEDENRNINKVLSDVSEQAEGYETKWSDYKLDGGSNYREIVFTMLNSSYDNQPMRTHWGSNAKGVLAHARIQDFVTTDGKKMLFIEEIQSDWHNQGRSEGYADGRAEKLSGIRRKLRDILDSNDPDRQEKAERLRENYISLRDELRAEGIGDHAVPDAPFKNTYHEYVLKRLLRMAAEQGYDCIGWTPAYMQSKRWSDEFAEAYRIEYDQDIPKFLKKYGRQWGAKVEREQEHIMQPDAYGYEDEAVSVWSMDLTDSMKDSVLYEGQTMYSVRDTFASQVDDVLNGKFPRGNAVYVGKTPKILQDVGLNGELPMLTTARHIRKANLPKDTKLHQHGLTDEQIKSIPQKVASPVMIMDSLNEDSNSIIVVTDMLDSDSSPVVVSIKADGKGTYNNVDIDTNFVTGYYGRDGFAGFIADNVKKNNFLYINKKKATDLSAESTTSWVEQLKNYDFNTIIRKTKAVVKGFSENSQKNSDRDPDGVSNRSILANALESAAQNDIELKALTAYKKNIEMLDNEEKRLNEINNNLKKLYFAEGEKDMDKIKELRAEKIKTANRINVYDKKLLNLESTKPLKAVLEREKQIAYKEAFERGKKSLQEYRERVAEKTKELVEKYKTSRAKNVEERRKTVVRNQIKESVSEIKKLYTKGTKERNVKIGLEEGVAKALDLADLLLSDEYSNEAIARLGVESATGEELALIKEYNEILDKLDPFKNEVKALEDGRNKLKAEGGSDAEIKRIEERIKAIHNKAEYKKLSQQLSRLNGKLKSVFIRERNKYNRANATELIEGLIDAFGALKESKIDYIKNAFSQELLDKLNSIKVDLQNVSIKDMSLNDLIEVKNAYTLVKTVISNANKIFRNGQKESLQNRVDNVQQEIRDSKNELKDGLRIPVLTDVGKWIDKFSWENLRPVDAFDRVGSNSFTELFWDAVHAQDTYARDIVEAGEVISNAREKYGYKKWDLKTATTFKSANGLDFKLTLGDMMSIYAYSFRDQAEEHMVRGGFTFADGDWYRDGKHKTYYRQLGDRTYTVGLNTIQDVINKLTPEQKAYVETIQSYLTSLGQKGNEVSRILYGIDIFNEEHYFPLQSSTDYRSTVEQALNSTNTMVSLKNTGMTKTTVPHASNPIVLRAFDDVVLEHIDKMSKYHAFVLAIENIQKVFNSSGFNANGEAVSTQALLTSRYGRAASQYFENYITDLNGGGGVRGTNSPLATFFSRAKGVSVAANLSVVVQQYFAVIRAMTMINPKHFLPSIGKNNGKQNTSNYEELKKYAPVAIIKEMGGFDVGSNRGAKDYIGFNNAPMSKEKASKTFNDITMFGASMMDRFGWVTIWKAVKNEIASTRPDLTIGSDEYFEACGKRFTEVVTKTQVYDSVNSRSGLMRSKHEAVKYFTSFMGEPTTSVGLFFTATNNLIRASKGKGNISKKNAWKQFFRTCSVLPIAGALTAVAKSLVQAMRDDDEDQSFLEKWFEHYGDNLRSDLNPLNSLPIGRDIMSVVEGYDVERPDMTLIADVINAARKLFDDGATSEEILNAVGAVGNIFGVPLKNVIRDARGIIDTIKSFIYGERTTSTGIKNSFYEGLSGGVKDSNTQQLYDAIMSGDTVEIDRVKNRFEDQKAIDSALRKALRENDPRIKEAAQYLIDGNHSERIRITREIVSEGKFSQDIVVGAINAEATAIKRGKA